jgi:hypothetical protein
MKITWGDTGIRLSSDDPISITLVLKYFASIKGNVFGNNVIFADVTIEFFKHHAIPPLKKQSRWLCSTEGDIITAWKMNGTMWVKNYPTTSPGKSGFVSIKIGKNATIDPDFERTFQLCVIIFNTFTRMIDYRSGRRNTVDHVNRVRGDNRFCNLRALSMEDQQLNRTNTGFKKKRKLQSMK